MTIKSNSLLAKLVIGVCTVFSSISAFALTCTCKFQSGGGYVQTWLSVSCPASTTTENGSCQGSSATNHYDTGGVIGIVQCTKYSNGTAETSSMSSALPSGHEFVSGTCRLI